MTLHTPPTTETQCQQYLNHNWPDFDQISKEGFWDQQQQQQNKEHQRQQQQQQQKQKQQYYRT